MKILVTGGAGFIGSNLIKSLLEKGYEVDAIDDFSIGNNKINGCNYLNEDIEEIIYLNDDYSICFHLAGLSRIQPSFKNPIETFRVNTNGTLKVLEWGLKNNVKIIYAGSSSVHHNPYQSPYALSKYLGEELCRMYNETYGLIVNIARFYNVYGPNEILHGEFTALIGKWRGLIEENKPLPIVGEGEQKRDFTYVDDIVDALIKISKLNYSNDIPFELGKGENYSINEVFNLFKERFPFIKKEYIPDQKGNYKETLRKNNEALNKLNWIPQKSLKDYIHNL
jgi:UDP-glucose 4-epimerase